MIVGIDDTDSSKGGCTTYIASLLCKDFKTKNPPRLIRLNPNIPYKTRGNGAVAIEIEEKKEKILRVVEKNSFLEDRRTNPGVVFLTNTNKQKKKILEKFYKKTLSTLVTISEAEKLCKKIGAEYYKLNNGRGIIGALAALGAGLTDKTYELIAYRTPENYGKEKLIDKRSVFKMNKETYPKTYDNIDPETGQVLITPSGYDPVFCGIRGETKQMVEKAFSMIKPLEKISLVQAFETNQGTDAHLVNKKISEIKPYDCVITTGYVTEQPKTITGGHVILKMSDQTGNVFCSAYEPTGNFRNVIRQLGPGDRITVFGGIGKYRNTINLEKIKILSLEKIFNTLPPLCCNKRMTSAGKNKGFKCKRCGKRLSEKSAIIKEVERTLRPGFYEVPPRARRHLSKPLIRMKPTT